MISISVFRRGRSKRGGKGFTYSPKTMIWCGKIMFISQEKGFLQQKGVALEFMGQFPSAVPRFILNLALPPAILSLKHPPPQKKRNLHLTPYGFPKIKMLWNLRCVRTRLRLPRKKLSLAWTSFQHSLIYIIFYFHNGQLKRIKMIKN